MDINCVINTNQRKIEFTNKLDSLKFIFKIVLNDCWAQFLHFYNVLRILKIYQNKITHQKMLKLK